MKYDESLLRRHNIILSQITQSSADHHSFFSYFVMQLSKETKLRALKGFASKVPCNKPQFCESSILRPVHSQ